MTAMAGGTSLERALAQAFPAMPRSAGPADLVAYARDLWPREHLAVRAGRPAEHRPGAIVWPTSTDQVAALVRWAGERGVALVPFGAGSGVCSGIRPREDLVVVDLKRMARVRTIDRDAPVVDVEAGHLGLPLEEGLARAGFTLGHFPSSILCSTVGGWVAARSAGQCSGRYGKIEDMTVALECVTGRGDVVRLARRTSAPDLVPLVVGSEGTLAIVTSATLRLHPAAPARGFGSWTFPTTRHGLEALREMFQRGLRPAVARLYDPFDAWMARRSRSPSRGNGAREHPSSRRAWTALAARALLRAPSALNRTLHSERLGRALGGAMLVVVFEGEDAATAAGVEGARRVIEPRLGRWLGEGPARAWLQRRYAVSYRQSPLFADGIFVDTMEVAARWSSLEEMYDRVREALGSAALVTAHFSHPYPDGCCIYFTFAGAADRARTGEVGWDAACEATYDRIWRRALAAASEVTGGTISHHHGVGRSKAAALDLELGTGVDVVRSLMRAFDPAGILNPGNLVPDHTVPRRTKTPLADPDAGAHPAFLVDRESLLVRARGDMDLASLERALHISGLTLDLQTTPGARVADWLASGAPGARDRWLDPADQIVAGFDATLSDGRRLSVRPVPRRAVGPDLACLFVGAHGRHGAIDRAWLRVHRRGLPRPTTSPFVWPRDPSLGADERLLIDAIAACLSRSA